jgi:methylated-DNA-[protein]-cysteine S-methyltransferase
VPVYFYHTKIGRIGIAGDDYHITHLFFTCDPVPDDMAVYETPLLKEAARQLVSYLAGDRKKFSVPLAPAGTDFMQKVWAQVLSIPYGQTACYGEIARQIGAPRAARAVGMANGRNPIPVFIPCHRVIGADGSLTGFRGGLPLKQTLLDWERSHAGF